MDKPDLSALAEQLCRIEHKQDLILEALAKELPHLQLRSIDDPNNHDPITMEPVTYQMDLSRGHAVRQTSQRTGLMPPMGNIFGSPEIERTTNAKKDDESDG